MVSKRIEHPLRTIELVYDEMKPLRPFEEEMLDRYTNLHNFVKELFEEYTNVQNKYELHDKNIRQVIARFRALKTRMNHLGENAKRVVNSMVPEKKDAEQVLNDAREFRQLLQGFHKDIQRLADESDGMYKVFIPLDNKDERLSEIFADYKQFRIELYDNRHNYSLDLEKYDSDEQEFIGSLTDIGTKQNEFIGVCNRVIDRYNMLVSEVEKAYEQWEEYNEMIEMLQLVVVTPYDISQVCLN